MTEKEAIKRIREHMIIHYEKEPRAIYITEALMMAIQALEIVSRLDKEFIHDIMLAYDYFETEDKTDNGH